MSENQLGREPVRMNKEDVKSIKIYWRTGPDIVKYS